MINFTGKLILTMFNIGKLGSFPGTVASGVTTILYLFFFYLKIDYVILLIIFSFLSLISIYLINLLEKEFDDIDSKEIVIDEYLGQSIPLLFYCHLIPEFPNDQALKSNLNTLARTECRLNQIYQLEHIGYEDPVK